jgi:predicted nucleic acid-binding protein
VVLKVLVDLNIVLDTLLDREGFSESSAQVLAAAERGKLAGYLCATSVDTLDYLLTRALDRKSARRHLRTVRRLLRIATVDESVIDAAISAGWADLEDAIVHESARMADLDGIMSRDKKGFRQSLLPVYAPQALPALLQEEE